MKRGSKILSVVMSAFLMAGSFSFVPLKTYAADPYQILSNGTTVYLGTDYSSEYNALSYYLNYPDLQAAFGTDTDALLEHYVIHGKAEGRVANRLKYSATVLVPSGDDTIASITVTKHDNGGMTSSQEAVARNIAAQIANNITQAVATYESGSSSSSSSKKKSSKTTTVTEVEKAAYAAAVVKTYLDKGTLTTSGANAYNAYGVFVSGNYNSAGATRALGLVLDYLGITWEHANLGTSKDQWCRLIVDGVEGYADATDGVAGTGKSPNEGGDGDEVSYADLRTKFSIY